MNPLSSIQGVVRPNGLIQFLPNTSLKAPAQQPIPAAELNQLSSTIDTTPTTPEVTPADGSFSNVLGKLVQEVGAKQGAANDAVNGLLSGQNVSLHQAMIATQEASVSFQLMVEVRNRLLDSYQELMRMQV